MRFNNYLYSIILYLLDTIIMTWSLFLWWVQFDPSINRYWIILNLLTLLLLGSIVLKSINTKDLKHLYSFFMILIGVSCFELITGSLWKIQYMGSRAYWFWDISWVLTILRSGIVYRTDFYTKDKSNSIIYYLWASSVITGIIALWANISGVLSYEPEAIEAMYFVWWFPLNILYYVPIWMFLTYSFKKYFDGWIFKTYSGSVTKFSWINIFISMLLTLSMEIIVEPIVTINGLPTRSYLLGDLNIFMLLWWTIIFMVSAYITNKIFYKLNGFAKIWYALFICSMLGMVMQSYLVKNNILVFSNSALQTYTQNSFIIGSTGLSTLYFFSTLFFIFLLLPAIKYWTNRN